MDCENCGCYVEKICESHGEPSTGNLTTKHSPDYRDFLFGGTITLCVGPNRKRMEIHKKLLASISLELDKHVNNDMKEGIEGIIHLPDEGEEVLTLFIEWAYKGEYTYKGILPGSFWGPGPWPTLHIHLQLCVFADKFNIPVLKELAESKFYTKINRIEPNSERDASGLILVIGYAYDNLPCSDPILKFLAQYASWKLGLLRETAGFKQLTLTQPGFFEELVMHLNGLNAKPAAPQKPTEPQKKPGKKKAKGFSFE